MPNLNIPIDDELMRGIRVKAAKSDMNRRDWVTDTLKQAVGLEGELHTNLEPCKAGEMR